MRSLNWGLAALVLSLSPLQASTISSCVTGNGGGGLDISSCSVTQSPNTLTITESFSLFSPGGAAYGLTDDIAKEYFVTKIVTNNTSSTWTGFDIYVGAGNFGVMIPTTWFEVDLTTPPGISGTGTGSASFTSTTNLLNWTSLSIAPGDTVTFTFALDVIGGVSGSSQIQQQPTSTPEPATMLLSATVLVALGAYRRRQRS